MNKILFLEAMRHSAAHLLAAAVKSLYPNVKLGIGPAIENGFYYDFDFSNEVRKESAAPFGEQKISEEDLPKIEAEMGKIAAQKLPLVRKEISIGEARELFKDQSYKLEIINEIKSEALTEKEPHSVSTYELGDFIDLCRGPHVKDTSQIKAFKLTHLAGAYWKGSEKNPMLTRIYGTVFATQKELDDYLKLQEEAKKRDHRKIGKELDLFVFSDLVGKGLPLFTEKGATIRRELERFIVDEEIKRGYQHVYTPDIAKVELYEKSGHYPYYKDSMYPIMPVDEERLILRPMTCPHHFQLYASRPRSYRELPVRIAELAKQYRYEKSGELTGLMRVRLFCLADAHIVCQENQAEMEINNVLDLIDYVSKVLGLKIGADYHYRLSKGDRADKKKFYKDDFAWDYAEDVLRRALTSRQAPFFEVSGEAAFYGPKIDIQMKNISGKEETAFTVQYDFVMPKRFELRFIDQKGEKQEPVVIHRSSIGALERVMAFLIERYAGAFPVWLSPVQVVVIPIADRHLKYAQKTLNPLKSQNIRAELDDRDETMQAKIRDAQLQKIPYMLIVGDDEMQKAKSKKQKFISVRLRSGEDLKSMPLEKFIERISQIINSKSLDLW